MVALKVEGGRGNWARESARGPTRREKKGKEGKSSRFQNPRAPEFLLSLRLLTPTTQATRLSETLHSNFRKSNKQTARCEAIN